MESVKFVERDLLRAEVLQLLGISGECLKRYLNGNPRRRRLGLRAICPELFDSRMEFFSPRAVQALRIYSQWTANRKAGVLEDLALRRGFPV